jgi:hypothetical protein
LATGAGLASKVFIFGPGPPNCCVRLVDINRSCGATSRVLIPGSGYKRPRYISEFRESLGPIGSLGRGRSSAQNAAFDTVENCRHSEEIEGHVEMIIWKFASACPSAIGRNIIRF